MLPTDFTYDHIFNIKSEEDFERIAMLIFKHQANENEVYRDYLSHLKKDSRQINSVKEIPFLPISFFKTHSVKTGLSKAQETFYSSGTTGMTLSKHEVIDISIYDYSLLSGFELAFGPLTEYSIYALLPSYHSNKNSSLLYMVNKLIEESGNPGGFYLNEYNELNSVIKLAGKQKRVMLIGVSYALIDFAENVKNLDLSNIAVVETGGMKGRRKEMTKADLHTLLKEKMQTSSIASEYGMTELLSQAWSKGDGIFNCPPWMKILTREYNDPFNLIENKTGGINVIDLANLHSCSFIETQDLGIVKGNQFEILGRFDNADLRGCNLLVN